VLFCIGEATSARRCGSRQQSKAPVMVDRARRHT